MIVAPKTSDPDGETLSPTERRATTHHLLPRSEGTHYRQLTLELDASGTLSLTWHKTGGAPEAGWGVDDNEVMLRVRGAAAARLAFALLKERLQGQEDGLNDLQALCARHDVDHELACWT